MVCTRCTPAVWPSGDAAESCACRTAHAGMHSGRDSVRSLESYSLEGAVEARTDRTDV